MNNSTFLLNFKITRFIINSVRCKLRHFVPQYDTSQLSSMYVAHMLAKTLKTKDRRRYF